MLLIFFLPHLHAGVCLYVRGGFWHKSAPSSSWYTWLVKLDDRSRWCWEPQGSWGKRRWKGKVEPCQNWGSAQRCSPSTLIHFLMVHFFRVIYKQILWTFCILERNICSLKYLLYFRTLAIWKMGILRDANKTVIITAIFLLAIFDQNIVAGKPVSFLFTNCISLICDQ